MSSHAEPLTPPLDGPFSANLATRPCHALTIDPATANYSRPRPNMASPPPTPHSARQQHQLSLRLRSNSGLSLHTNEEALRRYTDYNSDGSPRAPTFAPVAWASIDGVAVASRRSFDKELPATDSRPTLPIADFFGREAFQAVLGHPSACENLMRFAEPLGSEGDVDFLLKVQDYSSSLEQFVDHVARVPRPVDLPFQVSRSLNMDMKHLRTAVLPGLESIFADSRSCVEQRVRKETYPAFVKNQLASYVGSFMAGDRGLRGADFPGLGTSFCLTDARVADNPIVSASDGFLALTGYTRDDVLLRNCSFLQGAQTDAETAQRLRNAIARGEEAIELVLNYRRDSWPFWNLLCMFPLSDSDGTIQYYLGAQINVSETIGSVDDIVNALGHGHGHCCDDHHHQQQQQHYVSESRGNANPRAGRRPSTSTYESAADRHLSVRRRSSSTKGFFKQFKKRPSSPTSHNSHSGLCSPPMQPSASTSFLNLDQNNESFNPYGRFLLLQHQHLPSRQTTGSTSDLPRQKASRLSVAYTSQDALDLLGIDVSSELLKDKEIFAVLSDYAGSPSVSKSFRNAVRERVLRDGATASMNLMLNRTLSRRRKSLGVGLGSRSASDVRDGIVDGGRDRDGNKEKERERDRKPSRPASRSGFAGLVSGDSQRMDRVETTWAPLKDAAGAVEWVVVILTSL